MYERAGGKKRGNGMNKETFNKILVIVVFSILGIVTIIFMGIVICALLFSSLEFKLIVISITFLIITVWILKEVKKKGKR